MKGLAGSSLLTLSRNASFLRSAIDVLCQELFPKIPCADGLDITCPSVYGY